MPKKAQSKTGKHHRTSWKPGFLLASINLFWAAAHEPPIFSITSMVVWLLGCVTVGLLTKAILVVAEPLSRLVVSRVRQHLKTSREQQGA
ncbi:MAG TPA: hypothetical protein PLT25_08625 [Acidocella sp.]|nr:hypothetical protein [Acidocella sp.]HQU04768.1 hypothetical protein [Acidocella sp.]